MRFPGLVLAVATVGSTFLSTPAGAQPRPKVAPVAFDRTIVFQSCQTSTMFACGMTDASGHRYGTARETTFCTRLTFEPNGTFRTEGDLTGQHGTYKLRGKTVTLTAVDDDPDIKPVAWDLTLSADGEKLGGMTRQLR